MIIYRKFEQEDEAIKKNKRRMIRLNIPFKNVTYKLYVIRQHVTMENIKKRTQLTNQKETFHIKFLLLQSDVIKLYLSGKNSVTDFIYLENQEDNTYITN